MSDWVARGESIPHFLDEAIKGKIKKLYSTPCWLVVYLNISTHGLFAKETEATIEEVKVRHASSFEAISVLWNERLS